MPTSLWTLPLDAMPRGIYLAREHQRLLIWTDSDWLFWTNRKGERQAQSHFANSIASACISEDGSAIVVAESDGRFSWHAPDLRMRWNRRIQGKPTATAIDPLGLVCAVATSQMQLHLVYSDGEVAREVACPRAAHHLAFIPGTSIIVAAADLGWVGAYDLAVGNWIWRDAPVATIGGLAVSGRGEPTMLACYSEGMRAYQKDGKPWPFDQPLPSCRLVAVDYNAELVVVVGTDGVINGITRSSKPRFSHRPDAGIVGIALSALGDVLWIAQSDRKIVALSLENKAG